MGTGGFGSVFKMYDKIADRYDAIKYIKKQLLWDDMKFVVKYSVRNITYSISNIKPINCFFKHEGQVLPLEFYILSKVQGIPGIINVIGFCDVNLECYAVICNYEEGSVTLTNHIQTKGFINEKDSKKIFMQLLSAVQTSIEKNIFHRDIKVRFLL